MRIGIDGYNLAMPHGTGVATYGIELARALHAMGHCVEGVFGIAVAKDERLRETMFFDGFKRERGSRRHKRNQRRLRLLLAPPELRDVPLTGQVDKHALASDLPRFDRLVSAAHLFEDAHWKFRVTGRFVTLRLPDPPAVMHWTYPVPIRLAGSRNIYTLHDIVPLKLPFTTLDDKQQYSRLLTGCIAGAAQLCTVSEASKRDIIERLGLDPARITNTYQATTPASDAQPSDSVADARAIEGIFGLGHRGYFLYLGAIEPKKNVGRLIEAYLALQTKTPLVIVGARAWMSERELKLIPGGGDAGGAGTFVGHRGQTIVRLDYLPRTVLTKLLRGARALVFPSLYEGFGLPVLEAMQLGTAVITSTTASLPEVAGDAALLVDPYDVGAIGAAMQRLDADPALVEALGARGRERALMFAPVRYQERLAELYARALGTA